MNNLIKANLYYFFRNKKLSAGFVVFSLYSAVAPWIGSGQRFSLDASKYLSLFTPKNSVIFYAKIEWTLIILLLILGGMVRGTFKSGMIEYQKISAGRRWDSMVAMIISSWVIAIIFLLPIIFISIFLYSINGAFDNSGENVSLFYIVVVLFILLIDIIHIETNSIILSNVLNSEIKGFSVALGYEVMKVFLGWDFFFQFGGDIIWIPYGMFPLINCADLTSRVYWTRTNVPLGFDLGLPFIGFIIDLIILYLALNCVKQIQVAYSKYLIK